ncbi:hypothetical protein B296_00002155 [Ensete ventricosum]|uniref:Oligopeptide transporter OPT family protein n=1 Tax=Ensete ventricosum TaxID=4639 RepID=A0A427B2N9_ENSVE|nr:hypothetical protein B296_00002155 [Ensete ventricosum]
MGRIPRPMKAAYGTKGRRRTPRNVLCCCKYGPQGGAKRRRRRKGRRISYQNGQPPRTRRGSQPDHSSSTYVTLSIFLSFWYPVRPFILTHHAVVPADVHTAASSSSPPPDQVEEEEENSPIEQVALTVPVEDDPTMPVLTFRMWVLGTASCVLLSFLNQFFWYRKEPLSITSISAQIAVVPLGHLMATTVTDRVFFKGSRWEFTLNPGPFNIKEHVLITIFANSGAGSVYAIHVVTAVKIFYGKHITFFVSLLVVITTQVAIRSAPTPLLPYLGSQLVKIST